MASCITLPDPCGEDWAAMAPAAKGRHCAACAKTVVDFTAWSLENIAAYLRKHSARGVCGRFRQTQLNVPIPYTREQWVARVAGSGYPILHKVALIFLVAFGLITTSCNEGPGNISAPAATAARSTGITLLASPPPAADTAQEIILTGEVAPIDQQTARDSLHCTPQPLTGKPRLLPAVKPVMPVETRPEPVNQGVPVWVEEPDTVGR